MNPYSSFMSSSYTAPLFSTLTMPVSLDIYAKYYEVCLSIPHIFGKLSIKLPKSCTECQAAHQSCVLDDTLDHCCIGGLKQLLACEFAPTLQGTRKSLKTAQSNHTSKMYV